MSVVLGATQCDVGTLFGTLLTPVPPRPSPGIPAELAIFVQPTNVVPGAAIAPGVQVVVQDARGNTVWNSTVMITLGISSGAGATGAGLGGITAKPAVGGIATFNDLTVDQAASAYTLAATATGLTSVTSIPFDVLSTAPTVSLQSDPGDWVGQGQTYRYDRGNAIVTVQGTGGHLSVHVTGDETWDGGFTVPNGLTALAPGTYSAMGWFGEGRGCNNYGGSSFAIDDVSYRSGTLAAIDLRFEQHCDGASPALHGAIHWDADDPTMPPGPVNPIPGGLWTPAAGATPATDNYVYLVSEYGDTVGQGKTLTYTPANATITFTPSSANLSIRVDGHTPGLGMGYFQGMASITELQRGYYPNITSYPAVNPTRGGLSWSSVAGRCTTLRGWFVVDAVSYAGGTLTAIDLRFEQRCVGITPALHGAIHWAQ